MEMSKYYRPVGNGFLDSCNPCAFWLTVEGLKQDFPETKEIATYSGDILEAYFEEKDLDIADMDIYR